MLLYEHSMHTLGCYCDFCLWCVHVCRRTTFCSSLFFPSILQYTCVLTTFSAALFQVTQPSTPVFSALHFNHSEKLPLGLWLKITCIINAMFRCDKWKCPFWTLIFQVNQAHCIINYLSLCDTLTFTFHKCSYSVSLLSFPVPILVAKNTSFLSSN